MTVECRRMSSGGTHVSEKDDVRRPDNVDAQRAGQLEMYNRSRERNGRDDKCTHDGGQHVDRDHMMIRTPMTAALLAMFMTKVRVVICMLDIKQVRR